MASRAEWWALTSISRVGPRTVARLLDCFGELSDVLRAGRDEWIGSGALPGDRALQLEKRLARIEEWERMAEDLASEGITLLSLEDELYPEPLRMLRYPPPLLFARGSEWDVLGMPLVAIVGARHASDEGRAWAGALAGRLAERGLAVVSGMAEGIDEAAHCGALAAGGLTLGVLGCGLLSPRGPAEDLVEDVCRSGLLLSELQPQAPPTTSNLMARNRIVAGLARAVVVAEFGETSGTVNTARNAAEIGRPLLLGPIAAAQESGVAECERGAEVLGEDLGPLLRALERPLTPQPTDRLGLVDDQPELPF